jgi:DNA-binding GntR family transcriptional regulator
MSRTPIREALQQLHVEGMLEEDAGGLLVKKYTRKQVLEIYHCRAVLESEALKLIA